MRKISRLFLKDHFPWSKPPCFRHLIIITLVEDERERYIYIYKERECVCVRESSFKRVCVCERESSFSTALMRTIFLCKFSKAAYCALHAREHHGNTNVNSWALPGSSS